MAVPLKPMLLRNGVTTFAAHMVQEWYEEQGARFWDDLDRWEGVLALMEFSGAAWAEGFSGTH
jgi:hypothetical protein